MLRLPIGQLNYFESFSDNGQLKNMALAIERQTVIIIDHLKGNGSQLTPFVYSFVNIGVTLSTYAFRASYFICVQKYTAVEYI